MALHKLLVDDFDDDSYKLIAIHTRLEDYRLAYLLNKYLGLKFKRKDHDIDFKYLESSYSIFEWDNENFRRLLLDQFRVIVLIPVSALFSFVLISLFQTLSGNIEFDLLGLKFSGASGPVIMWVLSFSAIIWSIDKLWILKIPQ